MLGVSWEWPRPVWMVVRRWVEGREVWGRRHAPVAVVRIWQWQFWRRVTRFGRALSHQVLVGVTRVDVTTGVARGQTACLISGHHNANKADDQREREARGQVVVVVVVEAEIRVEKLELLEEQNAPASVESSCGLVGISTFIEAETGGWNNQE